MKVEARGMNAQANLPVLWHIPLSHYSEKVRWALDYKRIAHRRRAPGPDYLYRAWRATGQGKMPILFIDGHAIADSSQIIAALEERNPEPALYPREQAARQRALALEDYLDEQLGPALRAAIVTPLFRHDPDAAVRLLMTSMPDKSYRILRRLGPLFLSYYRMRHKIRDTNLEADQATVNAALDRIEQERQGRDYLVGDSFTVADLTAAAMLSALIRPPGLQYRQTVELPPYIEDYRARLMAHPASQWAARIYQHHRGSSAQVSRRADHEDKRQRAEHAIREG